jgi:ATP-binding cassette, subfamily B, multidrug efflux pump
MTGQSPAGLPDAHWVELVIVALVILIVRPLVAGGSVGLLHNTILTNFGTMMRWRAHRHVLRQPVGWFESDFAGRIANRIMQAPPAAG